MKIMFHLLCASLLGAMTSMAGDLFLDVKPLPLTPVEKSALENKSGKLFDQPLRFTPYNVQRPREPKRVEIFGDRKVYWADDPVGQFLVYFIGQDITTPSIKLVLEVSTDERTGGGKVVGSKEVSPLTVPKLALLLDTESLPPGSYRLKARLVGGSPHRAIPDYAFQKTNQRNQKVPIPDDGIPLVVGTQTNLTTAVWPIRTGIPLPRAAADSIGQFVLLEDGKPAPAQYKIRSTWYPNRRIKWLGLDFLARYENGKPRNYRLKVLKEGRTESSVKTPLRVEQEDDFFTVDTGALRFKVNRKRFTGIEEAWLADANGKYSQPVVRGPGGPWLVDERGELFHASQDPNALIEVEEDGPVRVTIHATGWYVSARTGEKLCLFKTRISAYAGQPFLDVTHRTIITYDTDNKQLADLAFSITPVEASRWQMGADGKTLSGDLPPGKGTVWLHQDQWDHFRVQDQDKPVAEGKQSDGWATETTKSGSLTVMLRNLWQLYPKEIELGRDAMSLHFWPRHGRVVYSEEEELARKNIHKIYYAHQGALMDLKFPRKYFDAIRKIMPMLEQQEENARMACGQGLAIGNDFRLFFKNRTESTEIAGQAALYQAEPHAIADPAWNAKTEAEGRFAPVDTNRFPGVEKVLNEGYRSNTTTPEILKEYGMWIWPDTHNNWDPASGLPEWHRIWNLSHYQNVGETWLLYLRSGHHWLYKWGRDNTAHYMNVGTVNYDDPDHPLTGHLAGAMYHVKGFLPWGSPRFDYPRGDDYVEVSAHFVDPDAFTLPWLLLGDQTARELMEEWGARAINRVALAPERDREASNTLGGLLGYYAATWDPQALLYIRDLTDEMLSRPWSEVAVSPVWHNQWLRRYWELARDERVLQRAHEWLDGTTHAYYQIAAVFYQTSGDKKELTRVTRSASTMWQAYYYNPGDPLDGFGPRLGALGSEWFAPRIPYFLQALVDAGIKSLPTDESGAKPVEKAMAIPKKTPFSPAGWAISEHGGAFGYIAPKGPEPAVQLEISPSQYPQFGYGPPLPASPFPIYVKIEDADGKVISENSYLHASKRPSLSLTLDARKQKSPWRFYKAGGGAVFKWDGAAESLRIGATPEEANKEPAK